MWEITQLGLKLIKADEAQISADNDDTKDDTEREDSVIGMDIFDKKVEIDIEDVAEDPAKWLTPQYSC